MSKAKLTLEEVKHVARLANLNLSDLELINLAQKLSETIEYVDQLQSIDTTGVTPTSQVSGKINQFREDVTSPSLSQNEALANAPSSHNGYFVAKIKWS